MQNILNVNGLMVWNEDEIKFREYAIERIQSKLRQTLVAENRAWTMHRIESSCLIPNSLVNPNYTSDDVFVTGESLTLRPETTAASYIYADHLMKVKGFYPPLVVWQAGKSFRNEQDNVTKNMRLKEFYQLEFQCVYADDTKNDYMEPVWKAMMEVIGELMPGHMTIRQVPSDRLPSYSLRTMDIEVDNGQKWMEVMSISDRTDYTDRAFIGKSEKGFRVLEVAVGLDRLVYNRFLNN